MVAAEVQWLQELLEQEEWDKVLQVSQLLLLRGGYTAVDYAWINYAICRARAFRQELHQAIPPGELARRLSLDTEQWDLLGKVLLVLGVSYTRTRAYDKSLFTLYSYFEHSNKYGPSLKLSGRIWHNIGLTLVRLGRASEAVDAFHRARKAYQLHQDDPYWFCRATQELVECCLEAQVQLGAIPALLADLRSYVTRYPTMQDSYAGYYLSRAQYAYQVKAYRWAASLCLAGLNQANKSPSTEFKLNLFLSRCLSAIGEYKDALGYALAARMVAIRVQAFDLEFIAIEMMYDLISTHGISLIQALDQDYLEQGLDMAPFVSLSVLPERRYS